MTIDQPDTAAQRDNADLPKIPMRCSTCERSSAPGQTWGEAFDWLEGHDCDE